MSLLFCAELYAIYCLVGALCVLFAFASWDWLRDRDAQRRMVVLLAAEQARDVEEDCAPDLFAHALEEIRGLPVVEPWRRWSA